MSRRTIYYNICSDGGFYTPSHLRNARRIIRRLIKAGYFVRCDREIQTRNIATSSLVFRNKPDYPINRIKI